jgi:hypothetical protein
MARMNLQAMGPSRWPKPTNEGFYPSSSVIPNSLAGMKLAQTQDGAKFVSRALHPNDETTSVVVGVPDDTMQQSAVMELRHNAVLSAPTDLPDGTNWDCELLLLPLVDAPIIYRRRASTNANWSRWRALAATQGQVLPGELEPQIYKTDGSEGQQLQIASMPTLIEETTGFRQTFKGLTVVMNSNSLTNQGIVTAGQWLNAPRMEVAAPTMQKPTDQVPIWNPMTIMEFVDIPKEPDDIVMKVGEAMQHEARKGMYMPMRFGDTVHLYNSAAGAAITAQVGVAPTADANEITCGIPIVLHDVGGLQDRLRFGDGSVWVQGPTVTGDIYLTGSILTTGGAINQLMGCVIFSGLDKKAMLMVKTRTGVELQPEEKSLLAGVVSDPPEVDRVAIDMVQAMSRKLPMAMEHKFNSLGAIVPLLFSAAKWALPLVAPWLVKKVGGLFSAGSGLPNV